MIEMVNKNTMKKLKEYLAEQIQWFNSFKPFRELTEFERGRQGQMKHILEKMSEFERSDQGELWQELMKGVEFKLWTGDKWIPVGKMEFMEDGSIIVNEEFPVDDIDFPSPYMIKMKQKNKPA